MGVSCEYGTPHAVSCATASGRRGPSKATRDRYGTYGSLHHRRDDMGDGEQRASSAGR